MSESFINSESIFDEESHSSNEKSFFDKDPDKKEEKSFFDKSDDSNEKSFFDSSENESYGLPDDSMDNLLNIAENIENEARQIKDLVGSDALRLAKKPPTESKGDKPTPEEILTVDEWKDLWDEKVEELEPKVKEAYKKISTKLKNAEVKTEEQLYKFLDSAEPEVRKAWSHVQPHLEDFGHNLHEKWNHLEPKIRDQLSNSLKKLKEII